MLAFARCTVRLLQRYCLDGSHAADAYAIARFMRFERSGHRAGGLQGGPETLNALPLIV